jgi:predicted adenine nucleotide alpha hydrolase (AANH) superfamily ATPase
MDSPTKKPRLLFHVCCATCAAYVLEQLRQKYQVTAYFYNPNIYPQDEYRMRFSEVCAWCLKKDIPFIEEKPETDRWFALTTGHENDAERGERCGICYRMRLHKTAEYAKAHGFEIFGTDLSISPHKDAAKINSIGKELGEVFGIAFLEADFKKQDGFKKAMVISREEQFYRQDYCGCIYSLKAREIQKANAQKNEKLPVK